MPSTPTADASGEIVLMSGAGHGGSFLCSERLVGFGRSGSSPPSSGAVPCTSWFLLGEAVRALRRAAGRRCSARVGVRRSCRQLLSGRGGRGCWRDGEAEHHSALAVF